MPKKIEENAATENALIWLDNDEALYTMMIGKLSRRSLARVDNRFSRQLLADVFGTHTPDGHNLTRVQITLVTEHLRSTKQEM